MNERTVDLNRSGRRRLLPSLAYDLFFQIFTGLLGSLGVVTFAHLSGIESLVPGGFTASLGSQFLRVAGFVFLVLVPAPWSAANRRMYRDRYHRLCYSRFEEEAVAARCLKVVMALLMVNILVVEIPLFLISGFWFAS